MAKEKAEDISFGDLQNLNLDAPDNSKEVIEASKKKGRAKSSKKEDMIKTSFKIPRDIHLALKQYSLIQGEEMAVVAFQEIIMPYLKRKGFYPPRKK